MAGASDPFSILNKGGQDMRHSQFQKRQAATRYWRGVAPDAAQSVDNDDDDIDIFPEARSFSSLRTEKMEERMREFEEKDTRANNSTTPSTNKSTVEVEDISKAYADQEEEDQARKRVLGRRRQIQKSSVVAAGSTSEVSTTPSTPSGETTTQQPEFKKPLSKTGESSSSNNNNNNNNAINEDLQNQAAIKLAVELTAKANQAKVEARSEGRAAAKARLLQRQKEEEEEQRKAKEARANEPASSKQSKKPASSESEESSDEDAEEDSDEEEDDDDEDDDSDEEPKEARPIYQMMRPVYIPKSERDFQSAVAKEEEELEEENRRIEDAAKLQNKMIIMEQKKQQIIGEDEEANQSDDSRQGEEFPNDDDDLNPASELEQWKIRELKRIRKDREEEMQREAEAADALRRANMTNEEIIAEDKALGLHQKKDARQYAFLQKYYHRGAFYQDDDLLQQRDFNMPVGEELVDKSVLPDILQKRRGNFGKKGQSKYTHLTDQDTTNFDPKYKVDQNLYKKMQDKQAGLKSSNVIGTATSKSRR